MRFHARLLLYPEESVSSMMCVVWVLGGVAKASLKNDCRVGGPFLWIDMLLRRGRAILAIKLRPTPHLKVDL